MKYVIFDIETDGLLDEVTKLHCLSYSLFDGKNLLEKNTLTTHQEVKDFLNMKYMLVGHNIIRYDIPALEKLLDIKISNRLIDTLGISWYQYPYDSSFRHGLAYWGERLGFGKPVVEDWKEQPIEVYINRCEADVEINTRLFHYQMDYCMKIYDNDINLILRLFSYLGYKLDCLKDQEEQGIDLDINMALDSKMNLEFDIDEKINILSSNMPNHLGKVIKTKPKNVLKKDGSLTHYGKKWFDYLAENDLDFTLEEIREKPNPGSTDQLKAWLISLGWKPITFKLAIGKLPSDRDEDKLAKKWEDLKAKLSYEKFVGLLQDYQITDKGIEKKVAQVSLPFGGGLCPSIKEMFERYPYLEELDGLYQAQHRFGLFKSYLENEKDGKVFATAHGFTNTLRLAHSKPVVNLPGVGKYYGDKVRGVLTVPDDSYIMCGSDISGLEDNTKQHYIYFFDPQYVKDMRVPGFDPHIDIAVLAEMVTKEDEEFFKWANKQDELTDEEKARFKSIRKVRGNAKVVNFSATYGAGPPKIAATLKCDIDFATKLHKTYWDRNKAVKQTANAVKTKTVKTKAFVKGLDDFNQKWLYNPISGFWYFLKADKDKFSTLNQGSGVYVFDSWLRKVREKLNPAGIKIIMQYHDELLFVCKKHQKEFAEKAILDAMEENNNEIQLNVKISCSVDWGNNYADCH